MTEEARLGRIEAEVGREVAAGELAGAAMGVWRAGQPVKVVAVGWREVAAGLPVEGDTIFRIASMTKPVTAVAAMRLVEEGRLALDEPIARWAPEFAAMRVLKAVDGPLDETAPAERAITLGDLLTHRAGFTYGDLQAGPIAGAYAAALGGDIDSEVAPDDWIAGLAGLPLIDQPGAAFHYGHSSDLLGLLIARIEGASLGEVLRHRIFGPLGMKDTGFGVEEAKRGRRAKLYGFDADGGLTALDAAPGGHTLPERPAGMAFESGGQGLWSTVDDYVKFARLWVEAGAVDGVRLLRPETVALMRTNQLTASQRAGSMLLGDRLFAAGHGFGLGVAVVMEPDKADPLRVGGGEGAVGWPGAFGSWWRADPTDQSVMVFMAHSLTTLEQLGNGIGLGVWEAIGRFQAAAREGRR